MDLPEPGVPRIRTSFAILVSFLSCKGHYTTLDFDVLNRIVTFHAAHRMPGLNVLDFLAAVAASDDNVHDAVFPFIKAINRSFRSYYLRD